MFGYNVGAVMSYMKTASLLQRGAQVYASRKARFIDIIPTEDFPEKTSFIGTEDLSDNSYNDPYTEEDRALQMADDYLDVVDSTPPKVGVIPIKPVDTYDFASLYGLTGATPVESEPEDLFEVEPIQPEPDPVIIEEPKVVQEPERTVEPVKAVAPEPVEAPEPVKAVASEPKPVIATPEPVIATPEPVIATPKPVTPAATAPKPKPVIATPEPTAQPQQSTIPDITGMNFKTQAQTIAKWYAKPIMQEAVLFEAFGKTVIMRLVSEGYLVRTKKGILLGS